MTYVRGEFPSVATIARATIALATLRCWLRLSSDAEVPLVNERYMCTNAHTSMSA